MRVLELALMLALVLQQSGRRSNEGIGGPFRAVAAIDDRTSCFGEPVVFTVVVAERLTPGKLWCGLLLPGFPILFSSSSSDIEDILIKMISPIPTVNRGIAVTVSRNHLLRPPRHWYWMS